MPKVSFRDLKIGDKFEVYGDTFINYDFPKICKCVKVEENVGEEIGGVRFLVDPTDEVFEDEKEIECAHPRRCFVRGNTAICSTCNPHPKRLRG